ncbi:MAG: type II toxin-antitoxin system Phd/YefM family antitoxin [Ferrovum sp.]|nr:type II toxin-antitoxin system Phd/YefM family antitoxin [Ferrovum sp.]
MAKARGFSRRWVDDVAEQRRTLVITKHGKPVAKLVPVESKQRMFGALKGNIVAPIDSEWESAK